MRARHGMYAWHGQATPGNPMPTFEDVTDTEQAAALGTGAGDVGVSTAGMSSGSGSGSITRELIEETVPFLRDPRPEIR